MIGPVDTAFDHFVRSFLIEPPPELAYWCSACETRWEIDGASTPWCPKCAGVGQLGDSLEPGAKVRREKLNRGTFGRPDLEVVIDRDAHEPGVIAEIVVEREPEE